VDNTSNLILLVFIGMLCLKVRNREPWYTDVLVVMLCHCVFGLYGVFQL